MVIDTSYRVITDPLAERAAGSGDRVFCQAGDESLTYAETWAEVQRVAGGLAALGVGPGTHVALMLDNGPRFLIAWFAVCYLGAVEVPVNTAFHGDALRYVLDQSESEVAIVDSHYLDRLAGLGPLPGRLTVLVTDDAEP